MNEKIGGIMIKSSKACKMSWNLYKIKLIHGIEMTQISLESIEKNV